MSLKRKLLLTTSTLLVATTPIATVVSCGGSPIDYNINDGINGQSKNIDVSSKDLRIIGLNGNSVEDGKASFQFKASTNVETLLKQASATYEYLVKYYWKGPQAKFETLKLDNSNNPIINDLRVEDQVQVKIKLNKPGFVIQNKTITKKIMSNSEGIMINWHEPATHITKIVDNMVKVNGDTLKIELNDAVKLNELIFAISKKLGYLFTDDSSRYVSFLADKNKNPITIKDMWDSLVSAKNKHIKKIELKNKKTQQIEVLNLEDMKNILLPNQPNLNMTALITKGATLIQPFKDIPLNDSFQASASVFTDGDNKWSKAFADEYKSVVVNFDLVPRLLTLIGAMSVQGSDLDSQKTQKNAALSFVPQLAVGYGNVFQWITKAKPFVIWMNQNKYLRDVEKQNISNTFMATLFRMNPNL